jgi:GNAT superfamily N-acetyltransferase
MCDEWMPCLELHLSPRQFRELPRQAAYSYSYYDGVAWLSPRPRFYHALLDLKNLPAPPSPVGFFEVRPLVREDWEVLPSVFSAAFAGQLPFSGIDDDTRLRASRQSLEQTRRGGDGPYIAAAGFVGLGPGGQLIGGVLPTLLPDADPSEWDSYCWPEPPPADALEQGIGRPHLTWIFVIPGSVGRGVGTALLHAAAGALLRLGYTQLASTFLVGNDSSMLWHWRNGFQLLSHPGSRRRG